MVAIFAVTSTGILASRVNVFKFINPISLNDFPGSSIAVPNWALVPGLTAGVFPPQLKIGGLG